jgi:hypothetical protein
LAIVVAVLVLVLFVLDTVIVGVEVVWLHAQLELILVIEAVGDLTVCVKDDGYHATLYVGLLDGAGSVGEEDDLCPSFFARRSTASSIGLVRTPVKVFCWEGW